ncbi:HDIG domain-containing metalloprotein [Desulfohalovibrio reitneri]|uniref:HDIG domain-containing metalloprotein n=1 Tax=Desulfohalovibrio reitneri TaxID=1307759 RepID=UPI0004A6DEE3|nr:HDIG domain-containing metalloprotein [Desulfohalovibrio reitneri]
MLDRDDALRLMRERIADENTRRHCLASEAVLRALAERLGHDPELWGLTGLLHDLDYAETHDAPERHGLAAAGALEGKLPEEAVAAIKLHNCERNACGEPSSELDWALRCGETVTGLITAAALVRPNGMEGMKAKSLKKKMKDKAFARSVSRGNIQECEKLGLDLSEFLTLSVAAMTPLAGELGITE